MSTVEQLAAGMRDTFDDPEVLAALGENFALLAESLPWRDASDRTAIESLLAAYELVAQERGLIVNSWKNPDMTLAEARSRVDHSARDRTDEHKAAVVNRLVAETVVRPI